MESTVTVDDGLVARLVADQHPDLADRTLELLARGWDNCVFRLGDDLVLRLPRRPEAAELIRHELDWLPVLAGRLHTPIPVPIRRGERSAYYPWSWAVLPFLEGRSALTVSQADRAAAASGLAEFAAQLHVPASPNAPHNPVRGVALETRSRAVGERLATGLFPRAGELAAAWSAAVMAPVWHGPALWLHGDPHPGNLLLDAADNTLAAVIDFGDLTAGDPATDLAIAWTAFDAEGREAFRSRVTELSPVDDATWQRARGWALSLGTAVVASPHSDHALRANGGAGAHPGALGRLGRVGSLQGAACRLPTRLPRTRRCAWCPPAARRSPPRRPAVARRWPEPQS
jgi:aminoglycoside phosphotransferase (APT) family kinase protein